MKCTCPAPNCPIHEAPRSVVTAHTPSELEVCLCNCGCEHCERIPLPHLIEQKIPVTISYRDYEGRKKYFTLTPQDTPESDRGDTTLSGDRERDQLLGDNERP